MKRKTWTHVKYTVARGTKSGQDVAHKGNYEELC